MHMNIKFTDEEIRKSVFLLNQWKASGPDGYQAGFFQKSWNTVGKQVLEFVNMVWDNPSVITNINLTGICLITKIKHPQCVSQFRPFSLCNSIYKFVSRVVVNRLNENMENLISPNQSGFVPGRNIQDNFIIANEVLHSMNKIKGKK